MPSHSAGRTGERPGDRTREQVAIVGAETSRAETSRAATARRWNELVHAYAAPGADTLLSQLPDRVHRPLPPAARKERSRIDAVLRRQAVVVTVVATAALVLLVGATAAASLALQVIVTLATVVAGISTGARWRRLDVRRQALLTDAHATWQMTRFGRWLVARAHQATLRATDVTGGPPDTGDRMAEALYRFTDDVRVLEGVIGSSSMVADAYGRLRQVRDHIDEVDSLLGAQAHVLRALDLFEATARDVVLAARAEQAGGGPVGVLPSLLDLQAEAVTRSQALAALDGPG